MIINTEIKEIIVTIDGTDYPVAEKTIDVAERLRKAEEQHAGKSPAYELWLAHMKIMLGDEAVKALFPKGRNENLDRMENVYYGVLSAFDYNGSEMREERSSEMMDELDRMAAKLKPLTEVLNKYPVAKAK